MKNSASAGKVEKELREVERRDCKARLSANVKALDALWRDDLIVGSTNLRMTKEYILTRLRDGRLQYRRFDRQVESIVIHGDSAATAGTETYTLALGPEADNVIRCSYMNCWTCEDGRWTLFARQMSLIGRERAAVAEILPRKRRASRS